MKWLEFGSLLSTARLAGGINQQADLATRLGVRQQTVSRWENGTSRPKVDQIQEIAGVLKCDLQQLLASAGYAPKSPPQATYDKPWPVDALPPDSFERFCTDFLQMLYPGADVHRYGDQGHTQDGLDIEAIFPDKTVLSFQCKRHASFGPKKVGDAVAAYKRIANKKVIILSGLASPQAREAIKKFDGWELWDREDISRRIRQEIPKVKQFVLVDTFFRGQRLALTGENEASPWYPPDKFFAGLLEENRAFSHNWDIVGRADEISELVGNITNGTSPVILLTGNGGSGKSRLLKEMSDRIGKENPGLSIYFLSREALTSKNMEQIDTGAKLLVCDDAHDRDDLPLLFSFAADRSNKTRLVIALRNYGLEKINQHARAFATTEIHQINLQRLAPNESQALALQAIRRFHGDERFADRLAQYTRDCPLATVIGAKVFAEAQILPDFLLTEDEFRNEMMNRLVKSVVDSASNGLNPTSVNTILATVAVLQPIGEEDDPLIDVIAKIAQINKYEVARVLRRLRESGVLFQRGLETRIAPDLLADFIIEAECITSNGQSTGFAEAAFDIVSEAYAQHVLVNLGRLDWIKSNGDTRQSRVLDGIWNRLSNANDRPHFQMRAVAAIAFYQPKRALDFVVEKINEQYEGDELPKIVRNVAYNFQYLQAACPLLWQMGQRDNRPINRTPSHPVRILAELATPGPNTSIGQLNCVVFFVFSLIGSDSNWGARYTPFEILSHIFDTEGDTTSSTLREVTFVPYLISTEKMAPIRRNVIDLCVELLSGPDIFRGYQAAALLEKAIRLPMGMFNRSPTQEERDQWLPEFCETLNKINFLLDNHTIAPSVFNRIARAVSWHAFYFEGSTSPLARQIIAHQQEDLATRTTNMLMNGWVRISPIRSEEYSIEETENKKAEFAKELLAAYSDPVELCSFIEQRLDEIRIATGGLENSARNLVSAIVTISIEFAKQLICNSIRQPDSLLAPFSDLAITKLLAEDPAYAESIVADALSEPDSQLMRSVSLGYAHYYPQREYSAIDIRALKEIVTSSSTDIVRDGSHAVVIAARLKKDFAIELLSTANLLVNSKVADDYIAILCSGQLIPVENLSTDQLRSVLMALNPLPYLEEYWIQEFLRRAFQLHPDMLLEFFKNRIEHVVTLGNWDSRPIPWGPYRQGSFGLMDLPESRFLAQQLVEWARDRSGDALFCYRFAEMIEALCSPLDGAFLTLLDPLIDSGVQKDMELVMMILREAPRTLVFDYVDFVRRFLAVAKMRGNDLFNHAISCLFGNAISGIRTGLPGEPFSQDISMCDAATDVLSRIGSFEPAFKLYEDLRDHANEEIKRQIRQGQIMNELEK